MEKIRKLEINDIHGSLKYLRQKSYKLSLKEGRIQKDAPIDEEKYSNFKKIFNEKNQLIKIEIYRNDRLFVELFYDENGNIATKQEYFPNGFLRKKYSWHYCEKGCLAEKREYFLSGYLMKKSLWKYSDNGNPLEKASYSYTGQLLYKNTFKYDEKNRITEHNYYNAQGNLLRKYTWKYDENQEFISKKIIEQSQNPSDRINHPLCGQLRFIDTPNWNDIILFDNKASKTEEYHYDSDGKLQSSYISFYDENKQIVKEIHISEAEKINLIYEYKYNDKGNISEKRQIDTLGNVIATHLFSYIYDKNMNWIQQVESINNIPIILTEREIEMF
ncbi:MAG: hypothetical protein Q3983_08125 [Capnocytophaga sp.]|nr:hypothetical protein [Capnocytophaga sp.]